MIDFIDETGFSYQVEARTRWAPKGRTPVLRIVSKRRQVSTAIGLTASGRIYKQHFDHAIHGEDMIVLLEHLRRRVGGPMILIWDRLQAHRSAVVKRFLAEHLELDVEWLPKYAPALNPEEGCHGNVKGRLSNATPETEEEIRQQADRGFARLRHRPNILLGFFHHVGLRVKRLAQGSIISTSRGPRTGRCPVLGCYGQPSQHARMADFPRFFAIWLRLP